jgi:hypothetical protein
MNVLMIEVRAEDFFAFCTAVMRDPDNFPDRRETAERAADLVDRIRQDEAPHVGYLAVIVSELRSFTFKTLDRGRVSGAVMIDPVWRGMVHWHAVINAAYNREQDRAEITELLSRHANGRELLQRFDTLERNEAA